MFICPTCQSCHKSYKSLHRHKTVKHPETISSKNDREQQYLMNPSLCQQCLAPLSYMQRRYQYCSHSCAATHSNRFRDASYKQVCISTWRRKLGILNRDLLPEHITERGRKYYVRYVPKPPEPKLCKSCSNVFIPTNRQTYCSPTCNSNVRIGKSTYRQQCTFSLNKLEHASLFNGPLISKYGWYCPANKGTYNPRGVTWDHLYRIEEGFANKIDPSIMSHPANAELIPWRANKNRKTSMITLSQLLQRVSKWDNNQRQELEYFYVD